MGRDRLQKWGVIGYRSGVSLNLTMPILCSGNLFGSKQQKSFDVYSDERTESGDKRKVWFNQGFCCFFGGYFVCLLLFWGKHKKA